MAKVSSSNPVFTSFAITGDGNTCTLGGNAQKGKVIVDAFTGSLTAKEGFPKGENIPYRDPFSDVPFGRAILCDAEITGSTIALTALVDSNEKPVATGTCYGTTIKDSATQLNCGFSVNGAESVTPTHSLVVAVCANATVSGNPGEEVVTKTDGSTDTVLAVSEAIDPTILQLGSGNTGVSFDIPAATGGFRFTVRGTLLQPDWTKEDAPVYTSFNDVVSSFPVSQAILDAKVKA